MFNKLINLYRAYTPEILRDTLFSFRQFLKSLDNKNAKMQKNILSYFSKQQNLSEELKKIVSSIETKGLTTFPSITAKNTEIEVFKDKESKLYYVLHCGHKLFFKKYSTKKTVKSYYTGLCQEQHSGSPHQYLTDSFNVDENSIVADIGAAEGNFSLSIVEKVKSIYIFESDENWILPLKKTFEPWKDKVFIVNKFVSDINDKSNISLDAYFQDKELPNFLKLDVEGFEDQIIQGGKTILNNNCKIALCTYHQHGDDVKFKNYFDELGFTSVFSDGYMLFLDDISNFAPPYIRRGVLRITK